MNSKLKAGLAVIALAAAGAAQADPIPSEGLFLSLRDSTNLTSMVVNLNLTTSAFRASPTSPYTLSGDGLSDLSTYLSTANLASVTWNIVGASLGPIDSATWGGMSTSSTNPASGVMDWGHDVIQNTVNQFATFRNGSSAGLTGSQGWSATGNSAFFRAQVGGTNLVNAMGAIGQSLGFYSFFVDPTDVDFNGQSSSLNGLWTLNFAGGLASLSFASNAAVPVPAAVWLLASGVAGLFGVSRRKRVAVAA